jgi:type I restriction enzyme M protein
MVASMDEDHGRMTVVMPQSFLFKAGEEGTIRRNLLGTGWLYGVIGLPRNIFYSTAIVACVLLFSRAKDARSSGVMFADASQCFTKGTNKNRMEDTHVASVVEAFNAMASEELGVACVSMDDIEANGFNLSIGRYVQGASDEEEDAVTALEAVAEFRSSLNAADELMTTRLREAGLVQ